MVDVSDLQAGADYHFTTRDWTTPENEVIPGETKSRRFVRHVTVSAIAFVEVARPDGTTHLIANETIRHIIGANAR